MTLIRTIALVMPLIFFSSVVWSGCTVTQDDGGVYTDSSVSSCGSYYNPNHFCANAPRDKTNACARMDMFFAVNWAGVDMINNAHRGVWGLTMNDNVATDASVSKLPASLTGPPENSVAGLEAAAAAGWRTVEYDVFLMRDDANTNPVYTVTLGHYLDMMNFGNYSHQYIQAQGKAGNDDGFLMGTEWADLPQGGVLLRDRDGFITNSGFANLDTFFDQFTGDKADMVIVLDPKFTKVLNQFRRTGGKIVNTCIGFCGGYPATFTEHEAQVLLREVVKLAEARYMLHRLIIKLPSSVYPNVQGIQNLLGSNFDKILFAPGPDSTGKVKLQDVLTFINSWYSTAGRQRIAFWDTSILSSTKSQGKAFNSKGVTYSDITHYLKAVTGKRSAIWIQDLSGPGGRHGNYYMSYTNYPGSVNDVRGDLYSNLYLQYAQNAVITTDRPDIFLQVKAYLKSVMSITDTTALGEIE